jgi:Planctomycete cytochrome C
MQIIFRYLSLGLNVFLLFVLYFREKILLPGWLQASGKLHPVILHIPIGILVLFALFHFMFKNQINSQISKTFLLILALSASMTAIFGFFLGQNGTDESLLNSHRNTGVIFSLLCYFAFAYYEVWSKNVLISNVTLGTLLAMMSWVGHQGGTMTHGEDFLSFSKKTEESKLANTVFDAHVMPIFKAKCLACHNDSKTKGGLNMSTIAKLIKGGKNGPIWKANDILHSKFLERALLPLESKEHMPPKGKSQLTDEEIKTLSNWVKEGALTNQKLSEVKPNSYFYNISKTQIKPEKIYTFSSVSEDKIKSLSTPYLFISPLSSNSPALKANFFVRANFKIAELEKLKEIKNQLVSIDLAKMPIGDEAFGILSKFPNLEHINLNQTDVKGNTIDKLLACKELKSISLANTGIGLVNLKAFLSKSKPLHVFLWSSNIQEKDLQGLKHNFDFGYTPIVTEKLKLNQPTLINENLWFSNSQTVNFKHTLKGVTIKYAINKEVLDSIKSKDFTTPIQLNNNTKIKVMAVKDGWIASGSKEYQFYKSAILPISVESLTQVDRAYGSDPLNALTDRNLGDFSNIRDPRWIAYQKHHMKRIFNFKPNTTIEGLTLSYANKLYEHAFPPQYIEVYIKTKGSDFKLFKKEIPKKAVYLDDERRNFELSINKQNVEAIKVIVVPLITMPAYMKLKPDAKPWFFTDEIFFY